MTGIHERVAAQIPRQLGSVHRISHSDVLFTLLVFGIQVVDGLDAPSSFLVQGGP